MCLSKTYIEEDGGRRLLLEEVSSIEVEGKKLILRTLFGEQKEIRANIREINFLDHNVTLGNLG
jgi:predicted RNA-binding protein